MEDQYCLTVRKSEPRASSRALSRLLSRVCPTRLLFDIQLPTDYVVRDTIFHIIMLKNNYPEILLLLMWLVHLIPCVMAVEVCPRRAHHSRC